jgi:hypothetical protein
VQAIGSSQNLTVVVSKRTEGEYYCHGISEGFDLGEKGSLGMCVSVVEVVMHCCPVTTVLHCILYCNKK